MTDPIFRQCAPDVRELNNSEEIKEDGLNEESQMPVPRLIHRYPDRVVLLVTNRCAVHCRFCFRKRLWKDDVLSEDIDDIALETVMEYLLKHPEVKEVLVSGGDPFMLKTERLSYILNSLLRLDTIEVIRIGTRIPVVLPMRVDTELLEMLTSISGLWIATHFNHPNEITTESVNACQQIIKAGIPIVNQTVLLAGVNDNSTVLETLFRQLIKIKVKPYYLFHVDPVKGVEHFATGLECGMRILGEFRCRLSSLAIPTFAIDLPGGGGKVPLQIDYRDGEAYTALAGQKMTYPF